MILTTCLHQDRASCVGSVRKFYTYTPSHCYTPGRAASGPPSLILIMWQMKFMQIQPPGPLVIAWLCVYVGGGGEMWQIAVYPFRINYDLDLDFTTTPLHTTHFIPVHMASVLNIKYIMLLSFHVKSFSGYVFFLIPQCPAKAWWVAGYKYCFNLKPNLDVQSKYNLQT